MTDDMLGVLVELRGDEVHVQVLAVTTEGLALDSWSPFAKLGTVRETTVEGARGKRSAWRWESEGEAGVERTRSDAVAAMLLDAGYAETTLTATIPDLLSGFEEER